MIPAMALVAVLAVLGTVMMDMEEARYARIDATRLLAQAPSATPGDQPKDTKAEIRECKPGLDFKVSIKDGKKHIETIDNKCPVSTSGRGSYPTRGDPPRDCRAWQCITEVCTEYKNKACTKWEKLGEKINVGETPEQGIQKEKTNLQSLLQRTADFDKKRLEELKAKARTSGLFGLTTDENLEFERLRQLEQSKKWQESYVAQKQETERKLNALAALDGQREITGTPGAPGSPWDNPAAPPKWTPGRLTEEELRKFGIDPKTLDPNATKFNLDPRNTPASDPCATGSWASCLNKLTKTTFGKPNDWPEVTNTPGPRGPGQQDPEQKTPGGGLPFDLGGILKGLLGNNTQQPQQAPQYGYNSQGQLCVMNPQTQYQTVIGGIIGNLMSGNKQSDCRPGYPPGTCAPQYYCQGNNLVYRQNTCNDQLVQSCQQGCVNNACKQSSDPSPDGPVGQLSCSPQRVENGNSIAVSYSCSRATTATGSGFSTGSALSGSTTVTASTTASKIDLSLTCVRAELSHIAGCSVAVIRPTIIVSATPNPVRPGGIANVAWASTGMESCTLSSDDLPEFTEREKNGTRTSGVASTTPIHATSTIDVVCATAGGKSKTASVTIGVNANAAGPNVSVSTQLPGDTVQQGVSFQVRWQSSSVPKGAAAGLFLVRQNDNKSGLILPAQPISGTYIWRIPERGDACNAENSGLCDPEGVYKIVVRIYTPANAFIGGAAQPGNPINPQFHATGESAAFTITR